MARLRDLHVALRDVDVEAGGDYVQVLGLGLADPALPVARVGLVQRHVVGRLHQSGVVLAGDLAQELVRGRQRALGQDHAGGGIVVGGARLLHVGDCDQSDLEAFLGLLELAGYRLQRSERRGQRVLGRQHVEIAARDADQQVLLGRAIAGLGQRDFGVRALQRLPLVPVENRLGQLELVLPVVGGRFHIVVVDLGFARDGVLGQVRVLAV